jgi:hypothetical protein
MMALLHGEPHGALQSQWLLELEILASCKHNGKK